MFLSNDLVSLTLTNQSAFPPFHNFLFFLLITPTHETYKNASICMDSWATTKCPYIKTSFLAEYCQVQFMEHLKFNEVKFWYMIIRFFQKIIVLLRRKDYKIYFMMGFKLKLNKNRIEIVPLATIKQFLCDNLQ